MASFSCDAMGLLGDGCGGAGFGAVSEGDGPAHLSGSHDDMPGYCPGGVFGLAFPGTCTSASWAALPPVLLEAGACCSTDWAAIAPILLLALLMLLSLKWACCGDSSSRGILVMECLGIGGCIVKRPELCCA